MLELKKIKKEYVLNDFKQNALNGVSLKFRENEFISILGPSGSGKTTLLNIVGGLDVYTSGDLVINGVSTKKYKDIDWDTYRNHNVGFVFQSYNLITHQSILANVELALTISGISSKERKVRAKEMLDKVGLKDHINKKPNQLSGGQMQRVAIARALVNNPDILLADEPTGALDTETSSQILDLLKEIAKDKLVIMVTHNAELAEEYSTRIVKLLDGDIISDSKPYTGKDKGSLNSDKKNKKFMSFKTSLSLSFNNLLTKKGRTILTAFAGSIGIIGIATILSLSNGVDRFIAKTEEDTLSSYPIVLERQTMDATSFIEGMSGDEKDDYEKEANTVYSNDIVVDMMSLMSNQITTNNLGEFKKYIENTNTEINNYTTAIQYSYDLNLQLYANNIDEVIKVNPSPLGDDQSNSMPAGIPMNTSSDVWSEMIDNEELLKAQYDIVAGSWATEYNEVLLVLNEDGELSDLTLYTLGLKDQDEYFDIIDRLSRGEVVETPERTSYKYEDLLNLSFKLVLNTDYYEKINNVWVDQSENEDFMLEILKDAPEIKVTGIIQQNEESSITSTSSGLIFYNKSLTEYVIEKVNDSEIAKEQYDNPEINVFTGLEFSERGETFDYNNLSADEKAYLASLSTEELQNVIAGYTNNAGVVYEDNLAKLGMVDLESPSTISIFSKDFESKTMVENYIKEYNDIQTENGIEENVISYTDYIGLLLSSVTVIVDMISYVLIAFVSISLIVSSIMIGVITYISVLERTKEIGILRAIGASKKDISSVFNAETFIIGLISGVIGITITIVINFIANLIIVALTGVSDIAALPIIGAIILIAISILLTVVAGLIPSGIASKKNPVTALRSE